MNDTGGYSATSTVSLTVVPALAVSATASAQHTDAGAAVVFSSEVTGGIGPDAYTWRFGDGGSSTEQNPSYLYAARGSYTALLWVNDSGGGGGTAAVALSIEPGLAWAFTASSSTPGIGQVMSIHAATSGGLGPYAYAYEGLPPGCATADSSDLSCAPSQLGPFTISVVVRDQLGVNVSGELNVTVVPNGSSLPAWALLLGGAAVAFVVAVAVVLMIRRRRNMRKPPGPGPNPSDDPVHP